MHHYVRFHADGDGLCVPGLRRFSNPAEAAAFAVAMKHEQGHPCENCVEQFESEAEIAEEGFLPPRRPSDYGGFWRQEWSSLSEPRGQYPSDSEVEIAIQRALKAREAMAIENALSAEEVERRRRRKFWEKVGYLGTSICIWIIVIVYILFSDWDLPSEP